MATNNLNVLGQLMDAITASGKPFETIDKKVIMSFFERQKVPRSDWNKLYDQLNQKYTNTNPKSVEDRSSSSTAVVDYSDNSHNDVKVRTPRKSVFGEITKIGG